MTIIALIVSLITLIAVLGGGIYAKRYTSKVIRDIYIDVADYFSQKDSEGFTVIDQLCKGLSNQVADTVQNKLTALSMSHNSHVSRQGNALERDMAEDYINSESPLLGLVLNSLGPKTRNRLLKNPTAIEYLLPKIQGLFNTQGAKSGDNNSWVKQLQEK